MKWPLFENNIKRKLSNHDSEIDMEDLWGSLESEVDAINNEKKKRRGFIWFFFGALLPIAIGMGFFLWNTDRLENSELAENIFEEIAIEQANSYKDKSIVKARNIESSDS